MINEKESLKERIEKLDGILEKIEKQPPLQGEAWKMGMLTYYGALRQCLIEALEKVADADC